MYPDLLNVLPSSTVIMKSSARRDSMVAMSPCLYAVFHLFSSATILDDAPFGLLCAATKTEAQIGSPARIRSEILVCIGVRIFSRSVRVRNTANQDLASYPC